MTTTLPLITNGIAATTENPKKVSSDEMITNSKTTTPFSQNKSAPTTRQPNRVSTQVVNCEVGPRHSR